MTGFDVYKLYIALKTHFNSDSYNFTKYNGAVSVNYDSYNKRNDRAFFERLSKQYDATEIKNLFISNFLINENAWIGDLITDEFEENYNNWKKINESLSYNFKQDVIFICNYILDNNIKFDDILIGNIPAIIKFVMRNEISFETVVILDKLMNFIQDININLDPFAIKTIKKIKKYKELMNDVDTQEFIKILKFEIKRFGLYNRENVQPA